MRTLAAILFVQIIINSAVSGQKRIQPTLFKNNRVYALQNQHAGNYLTIGEDGNPYRTSDRGAHSLDQLWKVVAINKEGFRLVALNEEKSVQTVWKPIYLGYGNYQLQNTENENCLEANQNGVETPCDKQNLFQQWFPTLKDPMQVAQALA